jgi:hypothetical protein
VNTITFPILLYSAATFRAFAAFTQNATQSPSDPIIKGGFRNASDVMRHHPVKPDNDG